MAIQNVNAVINSQTYILRWDADSESYKAVVPAPSRSSYSQEEHYYNVEISAVDIAGNAIKIDADDPTFGEDCRLRVLEKNPPEFFIQYPTDSSILTNSALEIRWRIRDDDSGVNPNTIHLILDDEEISEGIVKNENADGYDCSYSTVLGDGSHNLKFISSDNDGNSGSADISFKVDTAPPELVIDYPSNNFVTNQSNLVISGRTSDVTSAPVTLTVNDQAVEVGDDGQFSYEYVLSEGSNTLRIVSIDKAGRSSIVERIVILDTSPPIISDISLTPNPVDAGNTFIITVKVSD